MKRIKKILTIIAYLIVKIAGLILIICNLYIFMKHIKNSNSFTDIIVWVNFTIAQVLVGYLFLYKPIISDIKNAKFKTQQIKNK